MSVNVVACITCFALGLVTSPLLVLFVAWYGVNHTPPSIAYIRRRRFAPLPTSAAIEPGSISAGNSAPAHLSPSPPLGTNARPGSTQLTLKPTSCPRPPRSRRAGP